jgi:hypothetical protein
MKSPGEMKAYDAREIMKFEILTTGNEVTEKRLKDFKERLKKTLNASTF